MPGGGLLQSLTGGKLLLPFPTRNLHQDTVLGKKKQDVEGCGHYANICAKWDTICICMQVFPGHCIFPEGDVRNFYQGPPLGRGVPEEKQGMGEGGRLILQLNLFGIFCILLRGFGSLLKY